MLKEEDIEKLIAYLSGGTCREENPLMLTLLMQTFKVADQQSERAQPKQNEKPPQTELARQYGLAS